MKGKVSIITATYNNGATIKETAASVLGQTYQDWEWIVVINGSVDDTLTQLSSLKDDRIQVLQEPQNLGVSAARNRGIEASNGDFICFLDGDDILPANSLSSRMPLFQDSEVEFVDGKVLSFSGSKDHVIDTYLPAYEGNPLKELLALSGTVFKGNTWLIRRRPNKTYRFLEGLTHGEELLFYASICKTGNYVFTRESVLLYRRHSQSAMNNVVKLCKGYVTIGKELKKIQGASPYLSAYRSKASGIVFKSLVRAQMPFRAILFGLKILWQ